MDYLKGQMLDADSDHRILYIDKKRSHLVDGGTDLMVGGRDSDFQDNINRFWDNVYHQKQKGQGSAKLQTEPEQTETVVERAIREARERNALKERKQSINDEISAEEYTPEMAEQEAADTKFSIVEG